MEKIELAAIRDMGQTIGDSLLFIRQNFKTFLRLFVYYMLGPLIIAGILSAFSLKGLLGPRRMGGLMGIASMSAGLAVSYIIMAILSVVQNTYISMYMVLYENNKDTTLADVWNGIKENWKIILSSYLVLIPFAIILVASVVMIMAISSSAGESVAGLVAVFIYSGMFYAFIPLSNFYILRLREKISIMDALGKCFRITAGNWWRTITGHFIMAIIFYSLIIALLLPFYVVIFLAAFNSASSGGNGNDIFAGSFMGVYTTFYMFWSFFIGHILYAFLVTNYFSLSEKYDHFHLRQEIAMIGNRDAYHTLKQEGEY